MREPIRIYIVIKPRADGAQVSAELAVEPVAERRAHAAAITRPLSEFSSGERIVMIMAHARRVLHALISDLDTAGAFTDESNKKGHA